MKVGTKSLLFGVHQFVLHPLIVLLAWWRLYGFPWDPRIVVACIVHDWGYVGCKDMDGPDGERHPELGARMMHWLFDGCEGYEYQEWSHGGQGVWWRINTAAFNVLRRDGWQIRKISNGFTLLERPKRSTKWRDFCRYHSRYNAKRDGVPYSRLCVADKAAIYMTPTWLYLPLAWLSGELWEYLLRAQLRAARNEQLNAAERAAINSQSAWQWHKGVSAYIRRWVAQHQDGKKDTWTPTNRHVA